MIRYRLDSWRCLGRNANGGLLIHAVDKSPEIGAAVIDDDVKGSARPRLILDAVDEALMQNAVSSNISLPPLVRLRPPRTREPDMQARDMMVRGVISVQIAANAMVRNCVSALPVINIYTKLVGIVSEGDLIRRVEIGTERLRSREVETPMSSDALAREFVKSHAKRVSDVMTREVITAQPETPLWEIANLMEKHSIKRVPIVQDELVVGIVSRVNLLQVLARAHDNTDWVEAAGNLRVG
jgi:CBS domain-containing protein